MTTTGEVAILRAIGWPAIFAAHPTSTDVELAAILKVDRNTVCHARRRLDLPRRPSRRVSATKGRQLWTRCPETTHSAVHALAGADGVTASAWVLAAIVERVERHERPRQSTQT